MFVEIIAPIANLIFMFFPPGKTAVEQIKGDYQGEQVIANEFNKFTWALEPGDIFRLLALPFASCLIWEKIFSFFVHKFPHL